MEKTKDLVSTINPFFISEGRGKGNTTRQIDYAIQILFGGAKIIVQDHNKNGEDIRTNWLLYKAILRRLYREHYAKIVNDISEIGINNNLVRNIFLVNERELTIELINQNL